MVSGQHCRLYQYPRQFTLEDMGSSNGTYVDGVRIPARSPVIVRREQRITLGHAVAMPWPGPPAGASHTTSRSSAEARVIRIGRSPDCDIVLDYPMISWEHARIVQEGNQFILEDLNSRNGTAINSLQNRIVKAALQPSDDVFLASFKIPAARLLSESGASVGEAAFQQVEFTRDSIIIGRDPACEQPLDNVMISWHHARLERTPVGAFVEDLGSLNGTFVDGIRIVGRVQINPGQEVALGSFRFQLTATGESAAPRKSGKRNDPGRRRYG